jgi:hypothetical protein
MKKAVLLLAMSLFPGHLKAQEAASCAPKGSEVMMINGVGYSLENLAHNLGALRALINQPKTIVTGSSSAQNGSIKDVLIAVEQKVQERGLSIDISEILSTLLSVINGTASIASLAAPGSEILELITEAIAEQIAQLDPINSATTGLHHLHVRQSLKKGNKVAIVAHSQGTLYTNALYGRLTAEEQSSVKTVYIAAAAGFVADGSTRFLTSTRDVVIAAVPNALPAEVTPGDSIFESLSRDWLGHSFTDTYIHYFSSDILALTTNALAEARFPKSSSSNGPIYYIGISADSEFAFGPIYTVFADDNWLVPKLTEAIYQTKFANFYTANFGPSDMPPSDKMKASLMFIPNYESIRPYMSIGWETVPGLATRDVAMFMQTESDGYMLTLPVDLLNSNSIMEFDVTSSVQSWVELHGWDTDWPFNLKALNFPADGYMQPQLGLKIQVCQ